MNKFSLLSLPNSNYRLEIALKRFHEAHHFGLLVQSLVGSSGDNVVHGADTFHVLFEKLPDTDRVLATLSSFHFVDQGVGALQSHFRFDLIKDVKGKQKS